jgi:tetratricopeptide (TPR) repeat protein
VTSDADTERVLERAHVALLEQWEEWCVQRAMPAIEEVWNNYAPLNLEKIEQDLLKSLRNLEEIGCGTTIATARTWMYVGLVRAGENRDRPGAQQAFREALRIDPAISLDEPLADEATRSTWSRLSKELGSRRRARLHVPVREHAGLLQDLRKVGLCSSCSVAPRARAWILLGSWQALRREAGAVDSFREALALDPAAELDDRVRPPAAREAMQTARTPSSSK